LFGTLPLKNEPAGRLSYDQELADRLLGVDGVEEFTIYGASWKIRTIFQFTAIIIIGLAGMSRAYCFAPIEDAAAKVLILGSMPGKASLAAGEYYAHPQNIFWRIMGELVGARPGFPYESRLRILKSCGIAVWDVLESCIRKSSLDSHIEEVSIIPNDFESFFMRHPKVAYVFFNGAKAEQCFLRHVDPLLKSHSLQYQRLPSTSPANAGTPYEKKLNAWRAVMQ
jgi:TDG/mug DNA glycosylase family protein